MKLIIDIPEEDYKFIKDLKFYNSGRRSGRTIERHVINGIRNGIPYEERPKGEWIDKGSLSCRCNQCGCKSSKEYNFCPNCGADMRKADNG